MAAPRAVPATPSRRPSLTCTDAFAHAACVTALAAGMAWCGSSSGLAQSISVRWCPEILVSGPAGWRQQLEWTSALREFGFWNVLTNVGVGVQGAAALDLANEAGDRIYRAFVVAADTSLADPRGASAEPAGVRPEGFVWIPPGNFQMGSPALEPGRRTNEMLHTVTLTRGYWMSDHEVTQAEYHSVTGSNPSALVGETRPVEGVGWETARQYCDALTIRERDAGRLPSGYVYRLPTEAEWEYACRAGSEAAYPWGSETNSLVVDRHAWLRASGRDGPSPVRSRQPNAWGLYDMIGNVWEWCADWYGTPNPAPANEPTGPGHGSFRVARGGSYIDKHTLARCAVRQGFWVDWPGDYLGFRPVLAQQGAPGAAELHVRFVPELTLTGFSKSAFRIERSVDPAGTQAWQVVTQFNLGETTHAQWLDRSAGISRSSRYRAVPVDTESRPLGPGEPATGRPAGFIWIPPGSFRMGSPASEAGRRWNEPLREVTLTRGFWMSDHETTQSEFRAVRGFVPGWESGPLRPAETSWSDAVAYCEALTTREQSAGRLPAGFVYRLPTEAEWEFACRAGTTQRYYWGDDLNGTLVDSHAWTDGNTGWYAEEVRQKPPNPWGLYDMAGNLWEWCYDGYLDLPTGSAVDPVGNLSVVERVIRGGGFRGLPERSRSAARFGLAPWVTDGELGFRTILGPVLPTSPSSPQNP